MDNTVPAGAAVLLDLVGSIEAPKGYGTIYGNKQSKLAKPLVEMTLDEVTTAQKLWSKQHGSSAAGRYQFMRATLLGLMQELSLPGSMRFDANLQDRLGYHLLKRRGYAAFVAGRMSVPAFGLELAKEWASLPVLAQTKGQKRTVARGETYYAGDGLNKVLTDPATVEAVLLKVQAMTAGPKPATEPRKGGWLILALVTLAAAIATGFGWVASLIERIF